MNNNTDKKTISFRTSLIIIISVLIVTIISVVAILHNISKEHAARVQSPSVSNQTVPMNVVVAKFTDAPTKAHPLISSIAGKTYQDCQKTMPNTSEKDLSKNIAVSVDVVTPNASSPDAAPAIVLHATCTKLPPTSYYLTIVGKYWKMIAQATTTAPLACTIVNKYHLSKQIVDTGKCTDDTGNVIDVQYQ